jgi:hypothetical protein
MRLHLRTISKLVLITSALGLGGCGSTFNETSDAIWQIRL